MAERVRVREIDDDDGRRLLRIICRGTGSVVTWRRAQMVLLSAQGMPVAKIAEISFTSADRVRDVIHNFNADGFESLYPKYSGGRPKTFTLPERREIKKIAKSKPTEHDLPFSTWSHQASPSSSDPPSIGHSRASPEFGNPKSRACGQPTVSTALPRMLRPRRSVMMSAVRLQSRTEPISGCSRPAATSRTRAVRSWPYVVSEVV